MEAYEGSIRPRILLAVLEGRQMAQINGKRTHRTFSGIPNAQKSL